MWSQRRDFDPILVRHEQWRSGLSSVNLVLYSQKSRDGYDTVIVGWPVGLISDRFYCP